MKLNTTTRRFPRTMEEAFGPYEGGNIGSEFETDETDWQDELVGWACAVAVVAVILIVIWDELFAAMV